MTNRNLQKSSKNRNLKLKKIKPLGKDQYKKKMVSVFDTNYFFKILGLFYGDWNGQKIVMKNALLYLYSMLWFLIIVANVIRYTFLEFWPRKTILEFYLCDYAQMMLGRSYRWMICAGPLFNIWLLLNMLLFNRIHFDKKDGFWLRFLQIPKTRESTDLKIDGFSNEKIQRFWKSANFMQHFFLKTLAVMGAITMSLACLSYVYASRLNYYYLHPPEIFWTIVIANYCSLLIIGIYDFSSTFGTILYLYLTSKLLKDRFKQIQVSFNQIAYSDKKLNLELLDILIRRFNLIVDDLQKCNYFWCKFNFYNYYFGISLCSVLLLVSLYSNNIAIVVFAGILVIFVFVPVIVASFAICGSIHSSALSCHRPLMKLLERNDVTAITVIRILRMAEWISSDHSTFRVLDLFPMKKRLLVEVFFSIIAQSILLYDVTFNMFYTQTK